MSAALAGRGKVLCLTGEPGIGKTRLADEASMHATSLGIRVYWGRCFEDGGAPAYWPWIQVLRGVIADGGSQYSRTLPADIARMLPEFAAEAPQQEAGEAEQLRFRLFDAWRTPCSRRASVRDWSGSKTRSDPDTRAERFRSVTRRKHANAALREWYAWRIAIHAALGV
jgi:hypothetical protein